MISKHPADEALILIKNMRIGHDINVVDRVMSLVSSQPIFAPAIHRNRNRWTVAAAITLALGVSTLFYINRIQQKNKLDSFITDMYDLASYDYADGGSPICREMAMASYIFD